MVPAVRSDLVAGAQRKERLIPWRRLDVIKDRGHDLDCCLDVVQAPQVRDLSERRVAERQRAHVGLDRGLVGVGCQLRERAVHPGSPHAVGKRRRQASLAAAYVEHRAAQLGSQDLMASRGDDDDWQRSGSES